MKLIVTIIPTALVTNSLLSLLLYFWRKQKRESKLEQAVGLVTRNISVVCLQRIALYF